MSVLVKGMKMPENCYDCGFEHQSYCFLIDESVESLDRPEHCPLVEIPKPQNRPATWGDVYDSLKVLEALLETIEAEEGEAHDA